METPASDFRTRSSEDFLTRDKNKTAFNVINKYREQWIIESSRVQTPDDNDGTDVSCASMGSRLVVATRMPSSVNAVWVMTRVKLGDDDVVFLDNDVGNLMEAPYMGIFYLDYH